MLLIGAELPAVGIQPPAVDVDTAVPVDADVDAIFSIMRHGVGDTRHSDFAVVVRLVRASSSAMIRPPGELLKGAQSAR